jgi:hypothetical protein
MEHASHDSWGVSIPFLRRLLRRLELSMSPLSLSGSFFAESDALSQLVCLFTATADASSDTRVSGVFFTEGAGLFTLFGSGVDLLTLVNPLFTALNPPELMAVKPPPGAGVDAFASGIGTSPSASFFTPLKLFCKASEASRAGESAARLTGVLTLDLLIGVAAGLGVNGPPYSASNC